jgi:hypothetical protein
MSVSPRTIPATSILVCPAVPAPSLETTAMRAPSRDTWIDTTLRPSSQSAATAVTTPSGDTTWSGEPGSMSPDQVQPKRSIDGATRSFPVSSTRLGSAVVAAVRIVVRPDL